MSQNLGQSKCPVCGCKVPDNRLYCGKHGSF